MMSIDNTYDESEVRAFDTRVKKALGTDAVVYVLEPKIDGVAATLRYENRQLVQAATRGDGKRGDDITANVKTIGSVPLKITQGDVPRILEVRGEIYISNAEFQRLNKEREARLARNYSRRRGIWPSGRSNSSIPATASRKLKFFAHGSGLVEPMPTQSYWEWLTLLRQWRIPVTEHVTRVTTIEAVLEFIDKFGENPGRRSRT